jgi:hypothetical protein
MYLHAFVDESGDDGMSQRSTPWLILGALVISESDIVSMKQQLRAGIERIWMKDKAPSEIHFHKTTHPKRKALLHLLRTFDVKVMLVAAHKASLDPSEVSRLKCPALYHYMAKHVVERLTWYARDKSKKIRITFASRPQVSLTEFKDYFFKILKSRSKPVHDIAWEWLESIGVIPASQNILVQAADWLCAGIGAGLNADPHGDVETRYAEILWGTFWVRRGNLWSYGMKVIPTTYDRSQSKMLKQIGTWLEDPTTLG